MYSEVFVLTIKLITGTLTGFDTFAEMLKLRRKGFFYQWFWTKRGWGKKKTKIISELERSEIFRIVQTTGSGKTLLAAIMLYQEYKKHHCHIAANMNIDFADTFINNFDDLEGLSNYKILLDDIKHIITKWNAKEADVASEFANCSRKKKDEIYITSQRLENFVPPNIRNIVDEMYVPYIRCFDATQRSPDGRYLPLEIWGLRFTAGGEFMDYKCYNLTGKTGRHILDSFNTMEISADFNKIMPNKA